MLSLPSARNPYMDNPDLQPRVHDRAMSVEPKQLEYWRSRRHQQQLKHQQLAQQARQDLQPILQVLIEQFEVSSIILFGSLAKGRFTTESDIDLAVSGIAVDRYWSALAATNRLTQRWVDLKFLETLEPHFRDRVLATGDVIYERNYSQ